MYFVEANSFADSGSLRKLAGSGRIADSARPRGRDFSRPIACRTGYTSPSGICRSVGQSTPPFRSQSFSLRNQPLELITGNKDADSNVTPVVKPTFDSLTMWNKEGTSEYQERTENMDVVNPGARRSVLLEVDPAESRNLPPAESAPRHDLFARILGLVLCLAGVAIITGVIYLSYAMYTDPNLARLPAAPAGQSGVPVADVGSVFMRLVFRVVLLAVMSVSGSLIANKGIHMFLASFPSRER